MARLHSLLANHHRIVTPGVTFVSSPKAAIGAEAFSDGTPSSCMCST